jgi:hypothetical protein
MALIEILLWMALGAAAVFVPLVAYTAWVILRQEARGHGPPDV